MPQAYATKLKEQFAAAPLKHFYTASVADMICNRNYEGQIKNQATKLNVLSFSKLTWDNYTGSDMSPQSLNEVIATLTTDQQKGFYFKVKDIEQLKSFVKEPKGTIIEQLGDELKEIVDTYVLAKYDDVAAGQRVGTDYSTGTVTVTAVTGAVVGVGTSWTAAMVGRGFKATGHTKWYRVKTFTNATNIVIEDDSDDEASAYTGGGIAGGTAYTIEAATALAVTKSTVYAQVLKLRRMLNKAKVPKSDRYLVVSEEGGEIIRQAPELIPAVNVAYENVVERGIVGKIGGFTVLESNFLNGDNTSGFHCLAVHNSWQTMAEALVENEEEPFISGNFGKGYKGLFVYGTKVADIRRSAAAELFATFS